LGQNEDGTRLLVGIYETPPEGLVVESLSEGKVVRLLEPYEVYFVRSGKTLTDRHGNQLDQLDGIDAEEVIDESLMVYMG
ncbi:unnamed protein product, partial [marine sediment metagenome]